MPDLPPYHPDQPEEEIPGYKAIPEDEQVDRPGPGETIPKNADAVLPRMIIGCAPFGYGIFTTRDDLLSSMPLRLVRLALRAGVTAFDTAPWYHPSEIILGNVLRALAPEYPRESYQLVTKAGKFGPGPSGHWFDGETVRKSVERSLKRLGTDYLDVVFLHDVEFVASIPTPSGNPLDALSPSHAAEYHLTEPQLTPAGPGDQEILDGIAQLRKFQAEGKIKKIGISAFPLPTLLRIALLVLHVTGKPLDVVQTYMHQTLANATLEEGYLEAFTERAKVGLVTSASPLGMGLLTTNGCPDWHPARKSPLYDATREAVKLCEQRGVKIENVACDFSYKPLTSSASADPIPVVVGCKNLEELHASLRSFAKANGDASGGEVEKERQVGEEIVKLFDERGVRNWSWKGPVPKGTEASAA